MTLLPDPVWPVLVLALVCVVDGLLCLRPVAFVAACYDAVGWPRRFWWLMPPIKLAAAVGLVAGLWVPGLGLAANVGLVLYFLLAVAAHVRARDFGRTLAVNATGMLGLCTATLLWCFVL